MAQSGSKSSENAVTAEYSSPSETHSFVYPQKSASNSNISTEERVENILNLRKSVLQMQKDVNQFLTQKMEEDKSSAGMHGNGAASQIDEQKEEENYGEEADDD